MSQADHPEPPTDAPPRPRRALPRGVALAAIAALLTFIVVQCRSLFQEWGVLRQEMSTVRATTVIGYPGIQPRLTFARRPEEWFRHEGEATLLWSGWRDGVGHQWFRVTRGEVERERVSHPIGRDVHRAIDYPIIEANGGPIWGRIHDEDPVIVGRLGGVETAYPLLVLDRVFIVNDRIGDRPFLILYDPFSPPEARAGVFEPVVDGQRITMGTSGYFHDRHPMLYDRGTESLWVHDGESLRAISGAHKGKGLRRLTLAAAVPWSRWRSDHPEGRLVVGADRTATPPKL